ncbi:MAG: single-stranded DNA-binding protein [Candidatus Latescibacteria bacterium]|nr:single-stranded DNA-binding protein [Candidatus Latescibacterota bacterium]
MELERITQALCRAVKRLRFSPPVSYVYNPLEYAWKPHARYLQLYGRPPKEVVLVGMNPGPFGMAQTGVPFGEVTIVRDWLGISDEVAKPKSEHPRRPVEGFNCRRSEVSGRRFWGWVKGRFGTPERFFARFYVYNYCPLLFMDEAGRNLTPDRLPVADRDPLFLVCDRALRQVVEDMRPSLVVGVGGFAEGRARKVLHDLNLRIGCLLHPSPANPHANRDWDRIADRVFEELRVRIP